MVLIAVFPLKKSTRRKHRSGLGCTLFRQPKSISQVLRHTFWIGRHHAALRQASLTSRFNSLATDFTSAFNALLS